MTVLCTNSNITYSDLAAADAGEGGQTYATKKEYLQSGVSTTNVSFASADYPLGYIYRAAPGEETNGHIGVGAQMTGALASLANNGEIRDLRVPSLLMTTPTGTILRRLVVDAGGGSIDGIGFNNSIDAQNILVYNCNDGFLSSVKREDSIIDKCTIVGATRFGYAQGRFTNCVDVNSTNQGYFNETTSSSNNWEHDGTGTNSITESPATDIFVDFANGDYRIKADSSVGLAGAGAFIQEAGVQGNTTEVDYTIPPFEFSVATQDTIADVTASTVYNIPAIVTDAQLTDTVSGNTTEVVYTIPSIALSIDTHDDIKDVTSSTVYTIPSIVYSVDVTDTIPAVSADTTYMIPSISVAADVEDNVNDIGSDTTYTIPPFDFNITMYTDTVLSNLQCDYYIPSISTLVVATQFSARHTILIDTETKTIQTTTRNFG